MKKFLSATKLIFTMKCEQSTHLVSDSQDRELSLVERLAVQLHYIGCWSCRRFGKQVGMLCNSLRNRIDKATEPSLSPDAVKRIREAIDAE